MRGTPWEHNFEFMFQDADNSVGELVKFFRIERNFLDLASSLYVCSPANRAIWTKYPERHGFPDSEETAKANMLMEYRALKRCVRSGVRPIKAYVVLRSIKKEFHCGDGWLGSMHPNSRGPLKGLIPLTPDICIYFFSPRMLRRDRNMFTMTAFDWQMDRINEITQIYSMNHLFFRRQVPKLTDEYRSGQPRMLKYHSDPILAQLEEVFDSRLNGRPS